MNGLTCCAHEISDHEERPEQRRVSGNIEFITAPLNICYRCYDEYYEGKDGAPWWSFLLVLLRRAFDGRPPLWYRHQASAPTDTTGGAT